MATEHRSPGTPGPALALLERAKAGDKDAFGELAQEHRQALLRLCYKMTGSHETAEDLVQETFLKAYTHIAEFELRASLSTWLHRIATNACLDHQRGKKQWDLDARWQWFRDNGELVQQMEQTLYLSPERSAEVKEVAATCVNCIAMSLPAKQRAAIVLCDQVGLSREEAAQAIGASVASVKTELHRARKTMTEVFETRCALVDDQNECDGCLVAARIKKPEMRGGTRPAREQPRAAEEHAPGDSCAQIEELLSDLIDDQLAAGARDAAQEHIRGCARCGKSYRALKRSVRFVRANSKPALRPRTAGGVYADFVRAVADTTYTRDPVETIIRGVAAIIPERQGEIENWDSLRGKRRERED